MSRVNRLKARNYWQELKQDARSGKSWEESVRALQMKADFHNGEGIEYIRVKLHKSFNWLTLYCDGLIFASMSKSQFLDYREG